MKKTTWKSLLAVVFAFMLVFTAIIPAMAADGKYTITIEPGKHTDTSVGNRFEAYQIFTGTVQIGNKNQLANVSWGDGVNTANLIPELAGTYDELKDLASKTNTAKAVADFLDANKDDAEFAAEFAKLVEGHIVEANARKSTFDGTNFVIEGLEAGYYLVVDTYSQQGHDAKAANVLEVLNDKIIDMKSQVPEVDKFIVSDTDEALYPPVAPENTDLYAGTTKGDDYGIGDQVMFRLLGTLPENYDEFTTYYYRFIDHLSDGLDCDSESVRVCAISADGDPIDITKYFRESYEVTYDSATHYLRIEFKDLKAVTGLDNTYTIVVEYMATLNEKADIADKANKNTVQLQFSNNPKTGSTGFTNEEVVYVYTFELDFTKTNSGSETEGTLKYLEGVGFKLYKELDNRTVVYAKLAQKNESGKATSDWVIEDDVEWTTNIDEATEIFTDAKGKFNIQGLDAGTYFLTETTVPDGYEKMTDIVIKITASYNEDGTIKEYEATFAAREDNIADIDQTGKMAFTLINYTAAELPSTGGVGTTMYYVIGGIVLACAVVLLIVSKRRTAQRQ